MGISLNRGSTALITGDIEIGAVELKNATDDTRATIGANGVHVDVQASSGVGSLTETAPTTDTASSGLNGRLQRIAQRITSLISLLPTALGSGGGLKVDGSGTALPVSGTFYQTTQPVSVASGQIASGSVASGAIASGAVASGAVASGAIVDGANVVEGSTTGAAVVTDANGTIQQYLRGLVKLIAAKIGITIADGDDASIGATSAAAIITDATGTVQGKLRGLVKWAFERMPAALGQGTMAQSLPVVIASNQSAHSVKVDQTTPGTTNRVDIGVIAAGENHIGEVGGSTVVVNGSVTRPADTTAYAAGDVVTNSTSAPAVITFADCARVNAGSGLVFGAECVDSANQSTKATLELWLFDTTFTPDNDNAVFTPTDAELLTLVGIIQFSTWLVGDATAGAGGNCVSMGILTEPIVFVAGAATANLFGTLVVRNAYTPVSGEQFTVRLRILQD